MPRHALLELRASFRDDHMLIRPTDLREWRHLTHDAIVDNCVSNVKKMCVAAPKMHYRSSMSQGESDKACPICQCDFKPNRRVRRLACGHLFCSACLEMAGLHGHFDCAVCRREIVPRSPCLLKVIAVDVE
jgi:hypothetical protein